MGTTVLRDKVVGTFAREGPITIEPPRKGINLDSRVRGERVQYIVFDGIRKVKWD